MNKTKQNDDYKENHSWKSWLNFIIELLIALMIFLLVLALQIEFKISIPLKIIMFFAGLYWIKIILSNVKDIVFVVKEEKTYKINLYEYKSFYFISSITPILVENIYKRVYYFVINYNNKIISDLILMIIYVASLLFLIFFIISLIIIPLKFFLESIINTVEEKYLFIKLFDLIYKINPKFYELKKDKYTNLRIFSILSGNVVGISFRILIILSLLVVVIVNRYYPLFYYKEESTAVLEFVSSVVIIPVAFECITSYRR